MSFYQDVKADVVRWKREINQDLRQWWQAKKQETRLRLAETRQLIAEESAQAWRITRINIRKSADFTGSAFRPIRVQGQAVKETLGEWIGTLSQIIELPRVRSAILLPLQEGIRLSAQSLQFSMQTVGPMLRTMRHWVVDNGFPLVHDFTLAILRGAVSPILFIGSSLGFELQAARNSIVEIAQALAHFLRDDVHPMLARFFHALYREGAKPIVFVGRSLQALGISTRDGVFWCARQGKRLAIWVSEPIISGVAVACSTVIAESRQFGESITPWFRDFGHGFIKATSFTGNGVIRMGASAVTAGIAVARGINRFFNHYMIPIYHASIEHIYQTWQGFLGFSARCLHELGIALRQAGHALQQMGRVAWQVTRHCASDLIAVLALTGRALTVLWRETKPMFRQGISAIGKSAGAVCSAAFFGAFSAGKALLAICQPTWRAFVWSIKQVAVAVVMGVTTTAALIGQTFTEMARGLWEGLKAFSHTSAYVLFAVWQLLKTLGKGAVGFIKVIPKALGTVLDCLLFVCCLPCYAGRTKQRRLEDNQDPGLGPDAVQVVANQGIERNHHDRDRIPRAVNAAPVPPPWRDDPITEPMQFSQTGLVGKGLVGNAYAAHRHLAHDLDVSDDLSIRPSSNKP